MQASFSWLAFDLGHQQGIQVVLALASVRVQPADDLKLSFQGLWRHPDLSVDAADRQRSWRWRGRSGLTS